MIGVFDSGFGGLLVHRALTEALPQTDFVYLGDNKNAPYGTRPPIDVLTLTCAGVQRLFDSGCQLVIVACNTASTVALHWIQQDWLPIQQRGDGVVRNVIGIVVPTVEAALKTGAESIAIFATERTALTDTYPAEIAKRNAAVRAYQTPCPDLVRMIEAGAGDDAIRPKVRQYIQAMYETMGRRWPDCVILGCTHYALVAHLFAEFLPASTPIIDQLGTVAAATAAYLKRHVEFPSVEGGRHTYLSTGFDAAQMPFVQRVMGRVIDFQ